jgi:hypothetical protein
MTIGQLKSVCATYVGKAVADLTVNGIDLAMLALNSARLEAEQLHDFVLSQVLVEIDVDDLAGASLGTAKLLGTETAVGVKSIIHAGLTQDDGSITPIGLLSNKTKKRQELADEAYTYYDSELRYPSDATVRQSTSGMMLLQQGNTLYRYPLGQSGDVTTVVLEVYRWMPDYTQDSDTDFFTERAHNYMKWAAICEINHLAKHFLPREEGNLPPPYKEKQQAFEAMALWDDFIVVD